MKRELKNLLCAICGMIFFALGTNLFVVQAGLYSSGVVGISQIIRTILADVCGISFANIDISGLIVYAINIPLLILAWKGIGKRFFIKTVICVSVMTVFLTFIPTDIVIIEGQPFVNAIIGAIVAGFGTGFALRHGGSSGGTDILGLYIMKKDSSFSIGRLSLMINVVVYGVCALMRDLDIVIYSLIYVVVYFFVLDKVHYQNVSVAVTIVTKNVEIVKETIEHQNRSATIMDGKGAHTGQDTHVIYTIMSKYEARLMEHELKEKDKTAFMVVSAVSHVGGNFEKHL